MSATDCLYQASCLSAAASERSSRRPYWSLRPWEVRSSGLNCSCFSYSASRKAVRSAVLLAISAAVGPAGLAGEHAANTASATATPKIVLISSSLWRERIAPCQPSEDLILHIGHPGSPKGYRAQAARTHRRASIIAPTRHRLNHAPSSVLVTPTANFPGRSR